MMFKIKRKEKKEEFLFNIWELIIITLAITIFASVLTGYTVYVLKDTNVLESNETKDIIDTFNKIKNEYYEEVDIQGLADAAIDGMMEYLDEKYSVYMDGEETLDLNDKLNGNYEGIGIQIIKYPESNIEITSVFDNTPASKAGLKSGDIIKEVNGVKITNKTSADELTSLIKKSKNVSITILRDKEEKRFELVCETIDYPVVTSEVFTKNNKKIGYIYLQAFSKTATDQVRSALEKIESENIDSLVFDVRSNTGGYLNVTTEIASLFLKKGKVIYSVEGKNSKSIVYDETKEMRSYPIVVLIDGSTASASEILASCLKESYGAILIGTKSYGKGKVQQTSKLSDDTMIKYTTAKWFTPEGNSIDGIGLMPGITVELDNKYLKAPTYENDNQLDRALEFLANN